MFLPLSRGRAATRAVLCAVPTLLLGAATFVVYGRLQFFHTAISNRIVDYAVGVAALPLPVLGIVCVLRAARHFLGVVWLSPLGIQADDESLKLHLGPFGNVSYPARELDIRYPFELSGDFDDGGFEQFLPEEEQMARLLPRMTHPRAKLPINRTILRFALGEEAQIAALMRPAIEQWQKRYSTGESLPSPPSALSERERGDGDLADSRV
jgi:hypothetical protein